MVAHGFHTAAQGLDDLSRAVFHSDEEQGRAWASSVVAQSRLDWTQRLRDRSENAEPGAPEFTPKLLKDYDEYAQSTLASAPTKSAQRFLGNHLDTLRIRLGEHAMAFESGARLDYRNDQFTTAIDTTKKLMNTDPSQFPEALAEQLAVIDASSMPPVPKSALRQKAIDGISTAAVTAQIQKSPTEFLTSIGFLDGADPATGKLRRSSGDLAGKTGNQAFDMLPFEKRTQLFQLAVQQKAQIDADVERASTKLQKQIADDAMKEVYSRGVDGKLTRGYIESVRPVLSHAEYQSALKILEKPERGQKTDPSTFAQLLSLQAKDDWDGAVKFAFQAHNNGLLSNEHLASEVNRARTAQRQEGPKSEYERSRSYITLSLDPGPMVHDPVYKSRLAEAMDTFERFYTSGPNGKQPDEALEKRAKELVQQFKFVNMSDSLVALPMPRSGVIKRDASNPAVMDAQIRAAGAEAQRRLDAGIYTTNEYNQELTILNRWRKVLQSAPKPPEAKK